ncbi:MAG: hypothetical protein RL266_2864 [Bacteroidota bacterium]|jgi:radical SAM superfamily enzyme YgiQ (UPF0313 family)
MKQVKVFLADLRHVRDGVLFADTMPLGIGYMKAVIDRDLSDQVECQIFAYPDVFREAVINESPDVVMVTNYMWNEALSLWYLKLVKERNPQALTVMGGPNIAIEVERQIEFVSNNPQIDIYAIGEGDFLARDIVKLFIENDCNADKLKDSGSLTHCVYRSSDGVKLGDENPRSKELDEIPSPWLNGIMDKFFDNKLSPLYETNRGCPFTCTFCVQGTRYYTKVSHFGLNRVREELFYIADRIKNHSPNVKILRIADPNFGMYERDIDISRYMGETQKLYDYPMFIDATTGKNKPERIIEAMEQVSGAMIMWQSVQSLDDTVLTNVKRKNIKLSTYNDINVYLKGRGLRSQADLILCLPGESLESHKKALEGLTNSGVLRFNNFQAMLLKGSEMETVKSRKEFGFKAKHRLIQKNFSIHHGEKVFETEEIIISSDTFSFEEYIIARKYHLIINLFLNELRFEKLLHLFDSQKIPRWSWIQKMYEMIEEDPFVKDVFDQFAQDTENELFDSVEELTAFYSEPENYAKLERGEIGDNVIHKYRVISNYHNWKDICDFAYRAAYHLIHDQDHGLSENEGFDVFWNDLKTYQYHSSAHGKTREEILSGSTAGFTYDVHRWMSDDMVKDFGKYRNGQTINYHFALSVSNKRNLEASLNRWNTDLVGMSLMIRKIKQHWLEKEPISLTSELEIRITETPLIG